MYIDYYDHLMCENHKLGLKATINFHAKGWSADAHNTGTIVDKNGKELYTIKGSWRDELKVVDS